MALCKGWPTNNLGFPVLQIDSTPGLDLLRNVQSKAHNLCRRVGLVFWRKAQDLTLSLIIQNTEAEFGARSCIAIRQCKT